METKNFIEEIIETESKDANTRFPPEPNGYLHIGHAKSICLNFGLANKYNGVCNLRFDDTNPGTESIEYVEAIKKDIEWLGFKWKEENYASDYFLKLYEYAIKLIKNRSAYVCDLSSHDIDSYRGVPTKSGKESPYRKRSIEENLDLFERMRKGEFEEGTKTLRAKVDMSSPNLHMRDPILYRIKKQTHYRKHNLWNIYPTYDWAHGLSDWIEGITYSLCTLEFEVHRPLYDWLLKALKLDNKPRQIEFARLNLSYTVLSKRKLLHLVKAGYVSGWDDPRMPTLSGLRRRGYTPESIKHFCNKIGITKFDGLTDVALLESSVREHLNKVSLRRMVVLDPVKVVITNYPEGKIETLDAVNNPEDESAGTREIFFSRELFIERSDFMEEAPKKFFRSTVGKEVRLKYAYYITCNEVIKDKNDKIIELRCTYDPKSRGGGTPDGRKVKGTLHWVSTYDRIKIKVELWDRLFTTERPEKEKDFTKSLNPDSRKTITAYGEIGLCFAEKRNIFQFERLGYFCTDKDKNEKLVFHRTVSLRDTWKKHLENNKAT